MNEALTSADLDALGQPDADPDHAEFAHWWAQLPDFIKSEYPFDLPPDRLPFARFVFTQVGAPRLCPEAACRRSGECAGGDGPPCFRADRDFLSQVIFLWWMRLYYGCTDEEYTAALKAKGSPYAPQDDAPAPKVKRSKSQRRRPRVRLRGLR